MNSLSNTQSINYLDLIFYSKNKIYGAYDLRVNYRKSIYVATIITIFITVLSLTLPIILKKEAVPQPIVRDTIIKLENFGPPEEKPNDDISKINQSVQKIETATIEFTVPKVVIDELVTEEYMPTIKELEGKAISNITQEGIEGTNILMDEMITIPEKIVVEENKAATVFTWVEEMPSFPGGEEELLSFISSNINYPEIARKAGIEGRVAVEFIVDKDGTLSNINVLRSIGGGCDQEAVRVLKLSGKWLPGKQNGLPVRVKMIVPFLFKLSS